MSTTVSIDDERSSRSPSKVAGGSLRQRVLSELVQRDRAVLLKVSVLLVLGYASPPPVGLVVLRIVCGSMLVFRTLLTSPLTWWILVIVIGASTIGRWYVVDNHQFLIWYWTLACAIAVSWRSSPRRRRRSAALLVGTVFGLAVLHKIVSGEYADGSFFYWTLLTDGRVARLAAVIGGYTVEQFAMLSTDVVSVVSANPMPESSTVALPSNEALRWASVVLAWSTIVAETVLACLFLWPSERCYAARHVCLLLFLVNTYAVLPVDGFAFALAVLGLAQVDRADYVLRGVYLGALAAIQLVPMQWQSLFIR